MLFLVFLLLSFFPLFSSRNVTASRMSGVTRGSNVPVAVSFLSAVDLHYPFPASTACRLAVIGLPPFRLVGLPREREQAILLRASLFRLSAFPVRLRLPAEYTLLTRFPAGLF